LKRSPKRKIIEQNICRSCEIQLLLFQLNLPESVRRRAQNTTSGSVIRPAHFDLQLAAHTAICHANFTTAVFCAAQPFCAAFMIEWAYPVLLQSTPRKAQNNCPDARRFSPWETSVHTLKITERLQIKSNVSCQVFLFCAL